MPESVSPEARTSAAVASLTYDAPEGRVIRRLDTALTIGRGSANDLILPDPRISTRHARVSCEDSVWVFEDLDSTNGSLVNGRPETRVSLGDGDLIRLGHVDITFRTSTPDTGARVAPASTRREIPHASLEHSGTTYIQDFFRDDPAVSSVTSIPSISGRLAAEPEADEDEGLLLRRLKASYEISNAASAVLDLPRVLDRVLSALLEIFRTADRALIILINPDTETVTSSAVKSRVPGDAGEVSASRTALAQAIRNREAILCVDAMSDDRYKTALSIVVLGVRSLMIAPIVFQDDCLGAIYVDTKSAAGQFGKADLHLLSAAAAQVGACVANAVLHEKAVIAERLAAVGQTVAGLTHCIKNILQGIKGGEFIVEKALDSGNDEKLKTGWDMMRRNNAFMEELVFDLLAFSKPRQPEYCTADLNAVCTDIAELVSARAQARNIAVDFTPDASLAPFQLDPKGIRRCLLNLVTNAVDACPDATGIVALETRGPDADGFARVIVTDNGCGMPPETLAKLFTVFFSTKGSKGTGLGLPVTKKIIEEHNGRIDVDSREGGGTTFTVSLPAAKTQ